RLSCNSTADDETQDDRHSKIDKDPRVADIVFESECFHIACSIRTQPCLCGNALANLLRIESRPGMSENKGEQLPLGWNKCSRLSISGINHRLRLKGARDLADPYHVGTAVIELHGITHL